MPDKLPSEMDEVELIVRYLKQRADFWDQFPAHKATARAFRNEAHIISKGGHRIGDGQRTQGDKNE